MDSQPAEQPRLSPRARRIVLAGVVLVILSAGTGAAAIVIHHEHDAKGAEQAKHEEVSRRWTLERELERAITKEARERPGGIPEATISKTECLPTSGASSQELSGSTTGQFECIAVPNEPRPGGHETGYRYTATIEFESGRYTWRTGR